MRRTQNPSHLYGLYQNSHKLFWYYTYEVLGLVLKGYKIYGIYFEVGGMLGGVGIDFTNMNKGALLELP